MNTSPHIVTRRGLLAASARSGLSLCALGLLSPAALAELLTTPSTTEGPFYPDRLPLDTDNDLLIVNDATVHALGDITHLTGKVLGPTGSPIRNAVVEIWQCDSTGAYLHSRTMGRDRRDLAFQGYGRFLTDSRGRYYFRTIKPVPYPGRTPHIHFAVSEHGHRVLTTQMMIGGNPQNERDGVFRSVGPDRDRLLAEFKPIEPAAKGGLPLAEFEARFDIVLGKTPAEGDDGAFPGIVPKPQRMERG